MATDIDSTIYSCAFCRQVFDGPLAVVPDVAPVPNKEDTWAHETCLYKAQRDDLTATLQNLIAILSALLYKQGGTAQVTMEEMRQGLAISHGGIETRGINETTMAVFIGSENLIVIPNASVKLRS